MLLVGLFLGAGLLLAIMLIGVLGTANLPQEKCLAGLFHRCSGEAGVGEDEDPYMVETWSLGHGDVKVVRIPVAGMIMLGESSWYAGNANTALRSIRRATHDPEVKGLLLEINSGGGGITDSDIIYKAVLDFKAAMPGRAVVSIMGDVAASGAYYIALASDHIMAHPTTLTGSIGVIMQSYNFKELAAKLGVQDVTIKSGANKDLLNPFQEVKPEQKELLQKVISAMYDRFVTLVAENRKLPKEVVLPLADGRVFIADEAVKNRLIDSIGYNEDALVKMAELLKTDSVKVYRYDEQVTIMDLFSSRPGIGLHFDLNRFMQESLNGVKMMYRWTW
jgi:protease-4